MKTWRSFIGWPASLILLISYVLSESACLLIWGNLGGALWVALHFVLMPVLSVVFSRLDNSRGPLGRSSTPVGSAEFVIGSWPHRGDCSKRRSRTSSFYPPFVIK